MVQDTIGVAAAVLDDADLSFISGGGAGHKHSLPFGGVCYAAAVAGQPLDLQSEELVFM